ncbi:MAG: tail fiber domain-containing protein [Candidatus Paceibacterota bacterium]
MVTTLTRAIGSANTLNIGNLIFGTSIDGTGTTISSGSIGIASSTPTYRLSVEGDASITSTTIGTLLVTSSVSLPAGSIGPSELAATAVSAGSYGATNSTLLLTVDADGRLTSVTSSTISIGTDNIANDSLDFDKFADTMTLDAALAINNVGNSVVWNEDGTNADFRIEGDTVTNLFFVDADADAIGIGTSTPAYLLDVDGDFRVGVAGSANTFFVDSAGDQVGIGTSTPSGDAQLTIVQEDGASRPFLRFFNETAFQGDVFNIADNGQITTQSGLNATGNISTYGGLTIQSSATGFFNYTSSTLMGNTVIGLNGIPSSTLHVVGKESDTITSIFQATSSQTADITQWRGSDSSVLAVVNTDGQLGIGTTTPNAFLRIQGGSTLPSLTAVDYSLVINTSDVLGAGLALQSTDTGGREWVIGTAGSMNAAGGGVEAGGFFLLDATTVNIPFAIDTAGDVGIGSSTPTYRLSVEGDASITSTTIGSLLVTSSVALPAGSIGANEIASSGVTAGTFGDANEALTLTIDADGRITNLSTSSLSSGSTSIIDDDSDTYVDVEPSADADQILFGLGGTQVFRMATRTLEVLNSGESVFIGEGAGAADNLTANHNVAIGYNAGHLAVNVANSVFIGYGAAGSAAVLSSNNTAIGAEALQFLTAGGGNSAIGYQALQDNTTGSFNTVVGYQAALNMTNGTDNVAVGRAAMFNVTSSGAERNVAVGRNSLLNLTSGDDNVGIGYGAGDSITSGSSNVALGVDAGLNINTGSNNITIGKLSGTTLSTGSNNIIIGVNISSRATNSANTLNIGNLIFGTSLDGTGTTISTGNIGIASSTPIYRFVVEGDSSFTSSTIGTLRVTSSVALPADSITSAELTSDSVGADEIQANAVGSSEIAANAVGSSEIATGAVDSDELSDTGVASNTYGATNSTLTMFVNEDGRITSITSSTISIGAANIQADSLNFTEFADTMILDAALAINSGGFGVVWNEDGTNADFRIEGDTVTNLFFVDADADAIGIGTSTPAYRLDVDGDLRVGEAGSADAFFVDATNGYVGIGTTTPNAFLRIQGGSTLPALTSVDYSLVIDTADVLGAGLVLHSTDTGGREWIIATAGSLNAAGGGVEAGGFFLYDATGFNIPFAIDTSGNVGIGTSTPAYLLDVDGDLRVGEAGAANTFFVDTSAGQVGIGTTTPSATLTIDSSATSASPLAMYTNGAVGAYTATSSGIFMYDAAGVEMFRLVATDPDPSFSNYNTWNLYLGRQAGLSQPSDNSSAGYNNIGIGYQSLYSINQGNSNVALGNAALFDNTNGNDNTAIGTNALENNVTGTGNTALGRSALATNSTSHSNTAIGSNALQATTGANNTALGYYAGNAINSGANNITIGYAAGDNLTTGSNNIIIGYNIDAVANNSANTLNIGNIIFGTGIDGTGSSISSGNIGIGTTSPAFSFDIDGDLRVGEAGNANVLLVDATNSRVGVGSVGIAGAALTITGDIYPGANLSYDIGSSTYRFSNTWTESLHLGTSTWELTTQYGTYGYGTANLAGDFLTFRDEDATNPILTIASTSVLIGTTTITNFGEDFVVASSTGGTEHKFVVGSNPGSNNGVAVGVNRSAATLGGSHFGVSGSENTGTIAVADFRNETFAGGASAVINADFPNLGVPTVNDYYILFNNGTTGSISGDGAGGVQLNNMSDSRLKENIRKTHYGLQDLLGIEIVEFNYKTAPGTNAIGVVAQNVEEFYPEAVNNFDDYNKDRGLKPGDEGYRYMSVAHSKFIPLIIQSVQDVANQLMELESRVALQMLDAQSGAEGIITIAKSAAFEGNVRVKKHIQVGEDTAGIARILPGDKEVTVEFTDMYTTFPIITISPTSKIDGDYWIDDQSKDGFSIRLSQYQDNDVEFNWHSLASAEGAKISISDGTELDVNIVYDGAGQVAGEQTTQEEPTPEPEPAVEEETATSSEETSTTEETEPVDTATSTPPQEEEEPTPNPEPVIEEEVATSSEEASTPAPEPTVEQASNSTSSQNQ